MKPLAFDLIGVADDLRGLLTDFGLRPYTVWIIREVWTGKERGLGKRSIKSEVQLQPIPKITDLTDLRDNLDRWGSMEDGNIRLSEVSGTYRQDEIYLRADDVGKTESLFYEVRFAGPDGSETERRRFTTVSAPNYSAEYLQWTVDLQRAHPTRKANGEF